MDTCLEQDTKRPSAKFGSQIKSQIRAWHYTWSVLVVHQNLVKVVRASAVVEVVVSHNHHNRSVCLQQACQDKTHL